MQIAKWDYFVITLSNRELESNLLKNGELGWELITALPIGDTAVKCVFKRQNGFVDVMF